MNRLSNSFIFFAGIFLFINAYSFSANEYQNTPSLGQNAPTTKSPDDDESIGPCCTAKSVIGKPFTFKGKACYYNGHPVLRIWRIGTKRILGVRQDGQEHPCAPDNLLKVLKGTMSVYGIFTVYPVTESKPGVMQIVCIDSVRIIKVGY